YPGALAMVAIGCAGDSHPVQQGKAEYVKAYGQEIAHHVKELIESPLTALTAPPVGNMIWIKLPFAKVPTVSELIELAKTDATIKGYYARLALERIQRGGELPRELNYPIQTWAFEDKMVMVNMGNEVVVDYAI